MEKDLFTDEQLVADEYKSKNRSYIWLVRLVLILEVAFMYSLLNSPEINSLNQWVDNCSNRNESIAESSKNKTADYLPLKEELGFVAIIVNTLGCGAGKLIIGFISNLFILLLMLLVNSVFLSLTLHFKYRPYYKIGLFFELANPNGLIIFPVLMLKYSMSESADLYFESDSNNPEGDGV